MAWFRSSPRAPAASPEPDPTPSPAEPDDKHIDAERADAASAPDDKHPCAPPLAQHPDNSVLAARKPHDARVAAYLDGPLQVALPDGEVAAAEAGTASAQAAMLVWTKRELLVAFVLIWIIQFTLAFLNTFTGSLGTFVLSSWFDTHSLTACLSTITQLVGAIGKLPFAKLMNYWGRPEALAIALASYVVGIIMMAGSKNAATWLVAQIFASFGSSAINLSFSIFVADTTSLKRRAFLLAYMASPFIITCWISPIASNSAWYANQTQKIQRDRTFQRWMFGMWAIILPAVFAPFLVMYFYKTKQARDRGYIAANAGSKGRNTFGKWLTFYFWQFDVVGVLIIGTGFSLFLLAFNLYSYQKDQWRSGMIIAFIIVGFLLIVAFFFYEVYVAPHQLLPLYVLRNRTVVFVYIMCLFLYLAWFVWDTWWYSQNLVLYNKNITDASYMGNIYDVVSCFTCVVLGIIIMYLDGHIKIQSLFVGMPLTILGVCVMLTFNVGAAIGGMVVLSIGGGIIVTAEQVTVMAVSSQSDIASVLAIEGFMTAIGGAIGSSISSATWTSVMPHKLQKHLDPLGVDWKPIYENIQNQLVPAPGSPTRTAVNNSYKDMMQILYIMSAALYVAAWIPMVFWQNLDVRTMDHQNHRLW